MACAPPIFKIIFIYFVCMCVGTQVSWRVYESQTTTEGLGFLFYYMDPGIKLRLSDWQLTISVGRGFLIYKAIFIIITHF